MITDHYADDDLLELLGAEHATSDHLAACAECRDRLESFRLVEQVLHEEATWEGPPLDETPNPQTIATLRAFADQMAAEDAAAETYVPILLSGPRETWMENLHAHPEYRTPGVVRKLIEAASRAIDTMPRDAVEITSLATDVADHLDECDATSRLRGAAWRERAYAFFYTGSFAEADKAVGISERHLGECALPEYDLARLGIVRALVERGLENYKVAAASARESAAVFAGFEDLERFASARLAEVHVLYSVMDFRGALEVLRGLETRLADSPHSRTHAYVLGNMGYCYWKLGETVDAVRYHESAAAMLDVMGIQTEALRLRWTLAAIFASSGRTDDALARVVEIRSEFERRGMTGTAMLAALDIAEIMIARREGFEQAEEMCHIAMQSFRSSGLAHTARALSALALAREAAANRTVTVPLIRRVRDYIKRLPQEPELLFAHPAE